MAAFTLFFAYHDFAHNLPWSEPMHSAHYVLAVLATVIGVYLILALIEITRGAFVPVYFAISEIGLVYRAADTYQSVAWDDVVAIDPGLRTVGRVRSRVIRIRLHRGCGTHRRKSWVAFLKPKDWRETIELRTDWFAVGALPLLGAVRYYLDNPDARGEIGSEVTMRRIERWNLGQRTE
ncbi:hypothetical protein FOY51_12265 [Antrihabitans cavernicola]|uniref:PH domain-containing protein n=2 Tax=Antrihabitans cavernicola TaxID=2495913 RepID=A0A5A7S8J4_9NOCA|nr:hypothetical protein FOY51_12265 [Spelaeibacter cavernicola]